VRTEAQQAASRANGAKSRGPVTEEGKRTSAANSAFSTGPRTPEGKARSSRNADQSAMLADAILLRDESKDQFIELLHEYQLFLEPEGFVENRIVQIIAVNEWRRQRMWTLEMGTVTHATLLQEESGDTVATAHGEEYPNLPSSIAYGNVANNGRSLQQILRAEALFSRESRRARIELKELQTERRKREAQAFDDNLTTGDFIDPTEIFNNQTEPEAAPEVVPQKEAAPNPDTVQVRSRTTRPSKLCVLPLNFRLKQPYARSCERSLRPPNLAIQGRGSDRQFSDPRLRQTAGRRTTRQAA
jgi:hypothetical protein